LDPTVEVSPADLVRYVERRMIRRDDLHWRRLVGHAEVGGGAVNRKGIGRELTAETSAGPVVLRNHRSTRLDPGEETGQIVREIAPPVERPDADHHRVESAQFLRREIRAGERLHGVAELLEIFRGAVTGTGQIANVPAANLDVECRDFESRRWLQKLHRNVR